MHQISLMPLQKPIYDHNSRCYAPADQSVHRSGQHMMRRRPLEDFWWR